MAERPVRLGGLGEAGRSRIRHNIGGQPVTSYEEQLYGANPSDPVRTRGRTGWEYPDSTRVYAYSYDYDSGELWVRFKKYATPWVYRGVSETVFAAFDSTESKGRYINSTLNYTDYRRATFAEEQEHFDHA
jgi:hypothetical protein